MQLRSAGEYPTLCDVVGVTICNFKLWPTKLKKSGRFKVPMLSRWRLLTRASIALTDADRARILTCSDPSTLDRWVDNVFGAKTAAEVLS